MFNRIWEWVKQHGLILFGVVLGLVTLYYMVFRSSGSGGGSTSITQPVPQGSPAGGGGGGGGPVGGGGTTGGSVTQIPFSPDYSVLGGISDNAVRSAEEKILNLQSQIDYYTSIGDLSTVGGLQSQLQLAQVDYQTALNAFSKLPTTDQLNAKISDLQSKISGLQTQLTSTSATDTTKINDLNKQLLTAQGNLADALAQVKKLGAQGTADQTTIANLTTRINDLTKQLDIANSNLKLLLNPWQVASSAVTQFATNFGKQWGDLTKLPLLNTGNSAIYSNNGVSTNVSDVFNSWARGVRSLVPSTVSASVTDAQLVSLWNEFVVGGNGYKTSEAQAQAIRNFFDQASKGLIAAPGQIVFASATGYQTLPANFATTANALPKYLLAPTASGVNHATAQQSIVRNGKV